MRRDTVTVPAFSHIVIRFVADNPGLWALHVSIYLPPSLPTYVRSTRLARAKREREKEEKKGGG